MGPAFVTGPHRWQHMIQRSLVKQAKIWQTLLIFSPSFNLNLLKLFVHVFLWKAPRHHITQMTPETKGEFYKSLLVLNVGNREQAAP